jgi:hypothetical protein
MLLLLRVAVAAALPDDERVLGAVFLLVVGVAGGFGGQDERQRNEPRCAVPSVHDFIFRAWTSGLGPTAATSRLHLGTDRLEVRRSQERARLGEKVTLLEIKVGPVGPLHLDGEARHLWSRASARQLRVQPCMNAMLGSKPVEKGAGPVVGCRNSESGEKRLLLVRLMASPRPLEPGNEAIEHVEIHIGSVAKCGQGGKLLPKPLVRAR